MAAPSHLIQLAPRSPHHPSDVQDALVGMSLELAEARSSAESRSQSTGSELARLRSDLELARAELAAAEQVAQSQVGAVQQMGAAVSGALWMHAGVLLMLDHLPLLSPPPLPARPTFLRRLRRWRMRSAWWSLRRRRQRSRRRCRCDERLLAVCILAELPAVPCRLWGQ